MRKYFMVLALPVLASAQMTITAIERVSTTLKPDVLREALSFEEQNPDANVIKIHLNAIVAEVKRFDPKGEICHDGGYNLSPRYDYKTHKQEFIGYAGNLSFGCEFKTIDEFNTLSAAIEKVIKQNVRKNQGMLSWEVSAKAEREAQSALRSGLIRKASEQAVLFSKETGMRCNVASINFNNTYQAQPVMMKTMMRAESVATESPIQSDTESSVEATVSYGCLESNMKF